MSFGFRAGAFVFGTLAVVATGCSGSGGGGILDRPSGTITLTDAATGKIITTSPTNPYPVPDLRFSIYASEDHFAGPYDVKIVSQSNMATAANGGAVYGYAFNEPCFAVTQDATLTSQPVQLTFNGAQANGQPYNYPSGGVPTPGPGGAAPTTSGNPCHSGEFEQATITDTTGHTLNFYYEELP